MSRASPRSRAAALLAACLALAACANTARITAAREGPIAASPRTVTLDMDERPPFGMASGAIAEAVERAGFSVRKDHARYRLALTAVAGPARAGGYLPSDTEGAPTRWIARPDRGLRGRLFGGPLLRVRMVLIDTSANRVVWRGSAMLRTTDPKAAAPRLVQELMERLARG